MKILQIIIISTTLLLYGCSNPVLELAKTPQAITPVKLPGKPITPIYVKVHKQENKLLKQKVRLVATDISLIAAISQVEPDLSISADKDVDLNQSLNIKFNNQSLGKYLEYLSDLTGYYVALETGIIKIKSKQQKTWHLATLSLNTVELDETEIGELASSAAEIGNNSGWTTLIDDLKLILGDDSVVISNQQLGNITAIAAHADIKRADIWIKNLISNSNKQIHLQMQVLDIAVDESVGRGIDWDIVSTQSGGQFKINSSNQQAIDGAGLLSIGTLGTDISNKVSLKALVNILSKQGKVKIKNQPNITVINGRQAQISTGDEFSYVSSIKTTPNTTAGGNPTVALEITRRQVGVSMSVTPKILDDKRIAVSIVPVISSLKSFTSLSDSNSSESYKTPNIALQKLATQVIVGSGEAIQLGGLIAERISDAVKGLNKDNIALKTLFGGVNKSIERREIVILITPTIVN